MHVSSCLECVSEKVVKCALAAMHLIKNVEWRKEGVFLHMLFRSYLLLPLVFFFFLIVYLLIQGHLILNIVKHLLTIQQERKT